MVPSLLTHIASQTTCTINGQPTNCAQATKEIGGFFGAFFLIFAIVAVICLIHFVFWIIALIHILQHEDIKDRMVWLVIILLVPLGAIVYFFAVYLPYNKGHSVHNLSQTYNGQQFVPTTQPPAPPQSTGATSAKPSQPEFPTDRTRP
jgi:H+/Cl- antiporter ClcA